MSATKYDGYEDFRAGVRFIESLADWLQQFPPDKREVAYSFVRRQLVYVGPSEMTHLVELLYPETVQWRLMHAVADRLNIPTYEVWAKPDATQCYDDLLRKTLFIELSDGARIDIFRRANAGLIGNEQVVTAPRIIKAKWDGLLKDLRKDRHDPDARFAFVFLVDDFVGSGFTLLRRTGSGQSEGWDGKLVRFWEDLKEANVMTSHFEENWTLCVHHYLAAHEATTIVQERHREAQQSRGQDHWFRNVCFSYGLVLPASCRLDEGRDSEFLQLVQKYYDDAIETEHIKLGGSDARLGFGGCGLPLVLEHNTPNNSIALLWADTTGRDGKHAMRPLFRRRQRHA